jgi:catechol 2,3-dioxygenase-like lactoylglutathione lyase family enzyme
MPRSPAGRFVVLRAGPGGAAFRESVHCIRVDVQLPIGVCTCHFVFAGYETLSSPMLGENQLVAFVATTDGKRARQFYGETLGLRIISDDDFALVCEANGMPLRIQKVGSLRPQGFTVLGWEVADVEATVDCLVARGVKFERFDGMVQDKRGIWSAPSGARVAWFKDPDGNVLSLTQA